MCDKRDRAVETHPNQHGNCDRRQQHGFDCVGVQSADSPAHFVFGETIEPERDGERKRDPRQAAVVVGQDDHGQSTQADRHPLQHPQALAQEEYGQHNGHQRVDEVAQRRLDHVAD